MDTSNHFVFALSLLLYHIFAATCCGVTLPYGNMTLDYDLEIGSTLKIECTLFSNNITIDDKIYFVTSENLLLRSKSGYENTTVLDDLTIEYTKESTDVNDSGSYSCYLSIPGLKVDPLVCVTLISVGYKPQPVTNFSCVSLEYTNLTCSWQKPFNPVHTDYTLWDYYRFEALRRPCAVRINETSCEWRLDTDPIYLQNPKVLYFIMIGNNSLGINKQYINIDHFKIVKPGVPQRILISDVTKDSLSLRWLPPKGMEYEIFKPGLFYSMQYHPTFASWRNYEEINVSSNTEDHIDVGNLVPHTEYTFIIRCRSNATDRDDMWSPSVVKTVKTDPDVPYLAPEVTISSFEVETITGNRTITLYWKAIPFEFENGENFHYVMQYHIYHVPSRKVRETAEFNVGNVTTHSFPHIDRNSAYLFNIFSSNDVGRSSNTSHIVVDKADKLLDEPKHITAVSYGRGHYSLSWEAPNSKVKNFTLFWCQNLSPRPVKCKGPLQWLHTSKTYHELHLPEKNTNYQFAVASIDRDETSGMIWAPCVVSYSGVRYKIKNVELTPKNSTSVKIQWYLECEALKKVIKEYAIHYCDFGTSCFGSSTNYSCAEWKVVHVHNVFLDEYVLGFLKPYTCYQAFIRARTVSGWSENSNIAYEATMSAAPSDTPRDVKVLKISGTSIHISFKPPLIPNGIITRYVVYYNKSANGTSHHKEIRTQEMDAKLHISDKDHVFNVFLDSFVLHYTNYSIEVKACVDQACSDLSSPVYAFTDISSPGTVGPVRIELVEDVANISWDYPVMPNGPIDFYQILKESNSTEPDKVYNVTSQNYFALKYSCSENSESTVYTFRVRAVNFRSEEPLFGEFSKPIRSVFCPKGFSLGLTIGLSLGGGAIFIAFFVAIYNCSIWVRKEIATIKGTNIQLPKGLDSPMENPLSSYDKFKNGLQKSHDSGIPYERSYERLDSFASERDVKDIGNGYGINEQLQTSKRSSSDRNNSGESNLSNKCHDSISSSNTTKTHISIDSGAEVDSSPSPEDLCSDTASANTTPRSNKNDLDVIKESNGLNSKDSGLERDGTCAAFLSHDLPSKFAWCVKKKNYPFSSLQIAKYDGFMPAYSQIAILTASNSPSYVPRADQNLGLLDNRSLSNSEPSVADFDVSNGSEPLIISGMHNYAKFGLARSASNVTHNPLSVNRAGNVGYSKFGTVYKPLMYQGNVSKDNIDSLSPSGLKTCLKELCNHPKTTSKNFDKVASSLKSVKPNNFTNQCWNVMPVGNRRKEAKNEQTLPKQPMSNAYSKVGITDPASNAKEHSSTNPYIMYDDLVSPRSSSAFNPDASHGYSKIGMTCSDDNPNLSKGDGIIINPACLPSHNGYVQIPNAGANNDVNVPSKKCIFSDASNFEADCTTLPLEISNDFDPVLEALPVTGISSKSQKLSPSHGSNCKEVGDRPYILDSLSKLNSNGVENYNEIGENYISTVDKIPRQNATVLLDAKEAAVELPDNCNLNIDTGPVDFEDKNINYNELLGACDDKKFNYSEILVATDLDNNCNINNDEICSDFRTVLNGVNENRNQADEVNSLCNGQSENELHIPTSSGGYVLVSELEGGLIQTQ